jgi:putative chitinase
MLDRQKFFDGIRNQPFSGKLKPETVQGITAILDEWERRKLTDLRWLADMLATVLRECGPNMLPVREGFAKSDAAARAYVKRQGYKYAAVAATGHVYYGRGLVQLTWLDNYAKLRGEVNKLFGVDIVADPDAVLRPDIAAYVMFEGMIRGVFTGKKLADYFNDKTTDWRNARRIINGVDHADEIAANAKHFYADLLAARIIDAVSSVAAAPARPAPDDPPSASAAAPAAVTPIALPSGPASEASVRRGQSDIAPGAKGPPVQQGKHDGWFVSLVTLIGGALGAAWMFLQEWLPEILLGLAGMIVAALIIFRLVKGRWPWTGHHSLPSLPVLLPSSEGSSAQALLARLEALRAQSPATPLRAPSASRPRRTLSAPKSRATRKRKRASKSSRPSTPTHSSSRRKSK